MEGEGSKRRRVCDGDDHPGAPGFDCKIRVLNDPSSPGCTDRLVDDERNLCSRGVDQSQIGQVRLRAAKGINVQHERVQSRRRTADLLLMLPVIPRRSTSARRQGGLRTLEEHG